MIHYLHDSISYNSDTKALTYSNNDNKIYKINSNNWHKYLDIIGWNKLSFEMIKLINRNSEIKYKNSPYGVIDCGGEGDCLFHCVSNALSSELNDYYDAQDIRKIIADSIDDDTFKNIIETYRVLKDSEDFYEDWDPHNITSKEQFQEIIYEGGNNYWGDHILLQLLTKSFNLNVFIFKNNDITREYGVYPTYEEYNSDFKSIILLYENDIHFKLIGYFKRNMITLFKDEDIPSEIKRIYSII